MRTHHYPSDVTDEQWPLIEPHLPAARPGGRPRKTDMRDVVDAILYILRTGCQWRYLPVDFPPRSTVWRYFDRWRSRRHPRHDPRPAPPQGPHGGEALPPPDHRERRQPVGRHDLRRRAAGPRQRQERRRPEAAHRRRQHGLAAGRPGDGRLGRRRRGGPGVVRPAGGPADGQGRADVRRLEVPQLQALRVGRGERAVGPVHRPPPRGAARAG